MTTHDEDHAAWLRALPDDARVSIMVGVGDLTMREVRLVLATPDRPIYVSTQRASEMFGWASDYWRRAANAGSVPGAFKARTWHLPVKGCEAHIAARSTPKRRRRGPWFPTSASSPMKSTQAQERL